MDDGKRIGTILAGLTALGLAGTAQAMEARHETEHDGDSVSGAHACVDVPEGEMPSTTHYLRPDSLRHETRLDAVIVESTQGAGHFRNNSCSGCVKSARSWPMLSRCPDTGGAGLSS